MSISWGEMSTAVTCAPRWASSDGHRAGAAARVQHPRAAQVLRQAREHQRAHLVAALADGFADAAHLLMLVSRSHVWVAVRSK
jgi:hypothetical protein